MFTVPPAPSSIVAIVTTVHLALAAVRNHRRLTSAPVSSLAVVSGVLAALPWVLPSLAGLGLGLAIHGVWFVVCELLTPKRSERPETTAATRPRPPASPTAVERPAAAVPRSDTPAAAPAAGGTPPKGWVQAPVLATFDESSTIKTIRLARPDGFAFEAGQFLTVRVRVDGQEHARCYSISSAPDVSGYLEISVKRQGLVSNALHASVRPGGMLAIKRPLGAFKYPTADDRPLVLIAGGIGVTPLMSMLRHAVATEPTRPVTMIYSAHSEQDFAFRDELGAAARRHPQLKVYLASSTGSTKPYVYSGRIDESLLRTTVPDLAHSIALICGPNPMIDGMKTLLGSLGVPPAQIRYEVFQAAVAASAKAHESTEVAAPVPVSVAAAGAEARRAPARSRGTATAGRRMLCARSHAEVVVKSGQTLLEAAEEGGVSIDSLCRAGVCGTCRIQVTAGDVECDSTSLDAGERAEGYVLACVSTPQSDCTVNA